MTASRYPLQDYGIKSLWFHSGAKPRGFAKFALPFGLVGGFFIVFRGLFWLFPQVIFYTIISYCHFESKQPNYSKFSM
jgi:hypothetical protein